jgi:hypothetical protein
VSKLDPFVDALRNMGLLEQKATETQHEVVFPNVVCRGSYNMRAPSIVDGVHSCYSRDKELQGSLIYPCPNLRFLDGQPERCSNLSRASESVNDSTKQSDALC